MRTLRGWAFAAIYGQIPGQKRRRLATVGTHIPTKKDSCGAMSGGMGRHFVQARPLAAIRRGIPGENRVGRVRFSPREAAGRLAFGAIRRQIPGQKRLMRPPCREGLTAR
jgi:hypothetical protein